MSVILHKVTYILDKFICINFFLYQQEYFQKKPAIRLCVS